MSEKEWPTLSTRRGKQQKNINFQDDDDVDDEWIESKKISQNWIEVVFSINYYFPVVASGTEEMTLLEKLFSKAKEKWRERDTERKNANSSTACCVCERVFGGKVKCILRTEKWKINKWSNYAQNYGIQFSFFLLLSLVKATILAAISFDGRIMVNLLAPSISQALRWIVRVCTTRNVSCYWTAIGASDGWEPHVISLPERKFWKWIHFISIHFQFHLSSFGVFLAVSSPVHFILDSNNLELHFDSDQRLFDHLNPIQ